MSGKPSPQQNGPPFPVLRRIVRANRSVAPASRAPVASGGVKPEKIDLRVKAGDVITAKVLSAQYERGFMLFFLSKDKKVAFFSNTKTWKSFKPDNPAKWWEVTGKTASEPAAAGQKNYLKIEESAGFGPDAIWGSDPGQSYLLHVVDRQDISK